MAYSTGKQRYITAPSKWKRGEDEQVYSKVNQNSSSTGKTIQDRNLQVSGGIEINYCLLPRALLRVLYELTTS